MLQSSNNTTCNTTWKSILRWILFIPVAFIVNAVLKLIGGYLYELTIGNDLWSNALSDFIVNSERIIGIIVVAAISTYAAFSAGIAVAPAHKKNAAMTLMVLFLILIGIRATITIITIFLSNQSCWVLANHIADLITTCVVCIYTYKETESDGI